MKKPPSQTTITLDEQRAMLPNCTKCGQPGAIVKTKRDVFICGRCLKLK